MPCGLTADFEVGDVMLGRLEAGTELRVLEVRSANGRTRGRTQYGWVSFVSGTGKVLLEALLPAVGPGQGGGPAVQSPDLDPGEVARKLVSGFDEPIANGGHGLSVGTGSRSARVRFR